MTHLEQLIQDLCPNGVHWYSVNDLIKQKIVHTVSASIKLKRNQYLTEGTTQIISQEEVTNLRVNIQKLMKNFIGNILNK